MKVVGIDISKETFDVCLLHEDGKTEESSLPNDKSGITQFHRWLKKRGAKQAHVCMEATGVYGDALAEALYQRGYVVSVVNPARIKAYGGSQLQRNKTDRLDAALIGDFCRTQQPDAWTPASPEVKALRALVRHRDSLKEERQRVKNRLEAQPDRASGSP